MKSIEEIIEKHQWEWGDDNFEDWKITEIMYCKIGWCIDAIDGSEDLEEHLHILFKVSLKICKT